MILEVKFPQYKLNILALKNSEVTTLFQYKVMKTLYSLRMEVLMYISER